MTPLPAIILSMSQVRDWESLYRDRGVVQKEPSPRVVEAAALFRQEGLVRVLDLGCGTGRHTALLCDSRFQVHGCDASVDALILAKGRLPGVRFAACDMTCLPYRDGCFDGLLSYAVIQHGLLETIRHAVAEILRVVRPGGIAFVTVTSTEHPESLTGEEIEPNTRINIDAIDGDMPHHYFTDEEMRQVFGAFDILGLQHYRGPSEKDPTHESASWAIYARRPPASA